MTSIGPKSFTLYLLLVIASAVAFCLPQHYGWSWGVIIQFWALFGLAKLYRMSEPNAQDDKQKLSWQLMTSLFRRQQQEADDMSDRLRRFDSFALLIAGSLMVLVAILSGYTGVADDAAMGRAAYATLYIVAQIFCLGVIAFLAQLYAINTKYVWIGFTLLAALAGAMMATAFWRYGLGATPNFVTGWITTPAQGTDVYLLPHENMSPFGWRLTAMGAAGAVLPWIALTPMAFSFLRAIMHPFRHKWSPLFGLALMYFLGFYDLYGTRDAWHFAIVLPGWAALALAWGRTGYGPLWSPYSPTKAHLARFH